MLLLFVFGAFSYPGNNLYVVACSVGQGDSSLIYRPFSHILIDGGFNDLLSDCLSENLPWFDKDIEIIDLTHPQEDHMKGLIEVLENYEIGLFLTSGEINDTQTYWKLKERLFSSDSEVKLLDWEISLV